MAKNEIKVRKRLIDDSTLQRHRNYALVLKKHERAKRLEQAKRFFVYTLLISIVVVLLLLLVSYVLVQLEKNRELKDKPKAPVTTSLGPKIFS